MPVSVTAIADGLIAALVCEGDVSGSDFISATRELLHWEDARLQRLSVALVDQTGAATFAMDSSNIQVLVSLDLQLAKKLRAGFVVAVASPRDLQFGYSRMWQSLAEVTGWEITVVRDRADAVAWLRARAAQKFGIELPAE